MLQASIIAIDYQRLYEEQLINSASQEALIASLRQANSELRANISPMSNLRYEYISNLQYRNKILKKQVKDFESGKKYTDMNALFNSQFAAQSGIIRDLKQEVARLNTQVVTVRQYWSEVHDDMEKEHKKELAIKDGELRKMEERALNGERQRDEALDKLRYAKQELYRVLTKLEDEEGKNQKLKAQINRNHENSSLPSSSKPNSGKIVNNREKSGKMPGGQPGHEGHGRRWYEPTNKILIPAPEKLLDNLMYELTGDIVSKQKVGLRFEIVVDEYSTPVFRHIITGQLVHADFPEGMDNEVTYDGSVKGMAFLLNSYYNVAIDKVRDFISDITNGELRLSHGMICNLSRQFSIKTKGDRKNIFAALLQSEVMNIDFTGARVNGKKRNVLVCSDGSNVLYSARMNKGHKGVMSSPIETYLGTLVHDHDLTFYKYGRDHQECMDHILRYLKDSMENEPNLKWSTKMRELIREMIHFRKHLDLEDGKNPDQAEPEKVADLVRRYDELLEMAMNEYNYEPPSKYYMKGYNLYERLEKFKANHLLFLYDGRVPYSNSLSERLLRIFKRKEHQVMTFRSYSGLEYLCDALSVIASIREQGKNLYQEVVGIFERKRLAESQ
jgi:hypothetical protein